MSRRGRRSAIAGVLALLAATPAASVSAADPKPPSANDPGGLAVALITAGIDYMQADIARRLARDGEGEPIAWDIVDGDARPYAASGSAGAPDGTALMRQLPEGRVRVIAVRADFKDRLSLARAVAFAARTPAAVIVVPAGGEQAPDGTPDPLTLAMGHFADRLFVAAASGAGGQAHPNLVGVGSAGDGSGGRAADVQVAASQAGADAAVQVISVFLRCGAGELATGTGAERKARLLAAIAQPSAAAGSVALIKPCP